MCYKSTTYLLTQPEVYVVNYDGRIELTPCVMCIKSSKRQTANKHTTQWASHVRGLAA